MPVTLDYSFMLAPPVAGAIVEAEFREAQGTFAEALAAVYQRQAAGELGFLDLPYDTALLDSAEQEAARAPDGTDDVIVLGIGGSALGTIALRSALLTPMWNTLDHSARGGRPRLHVLDNVDPRGIIPLLRDIPFTRAKVIVVSKSGSTAETMSQYLIMRARLNEAVGEQAARERLVFITDPREGALRRLARSEGISALDVPENVGGRFSVLSPVGMLPALLVGIDARAILRGAVEMAARCRTEILHENPAGLFAVLQWLSHSRSGRGIHVLMPYSDALRDLSNWFVQLWAESLGKTDRQGRASGPTPLAAVGASDQHSLLQLLMDGPADKTITFVAAGTSGEDVQIPALHGGSPELEYLGGHTLGELLDAERRATASALAVRGRPSMTIELSALDAHNLGELIMLLQIATLIAGELYGVNALGQPGVELGKQFTYALMGRPGSERALREWESGPKPDPWRRV